MQNKFFLEVAAYILVTPCITTLNVRNKSRKSNRNVSNKRQEGKSVSVKTHRRTLLEDQ